MLHILVAGIIEMYTIFLYNVSQKLVQKRKKIILGSHSQEYYLYLGILH